MNGEHLKILHVYHIGDSPEDDTRIAFSPAAIKYIASRDAKVRDRDVKEVQIFFDDGDMQLFLVSGLDLMRLEQVVAGYAEDF